MIRAPRCSTSDFGPDLKPAEKDGKGKITKVSLDGKIIEDEIPPAKGQVLNKPKGLWIKGNRLWATDIELVWVFDLKTKEGKKLELPGVQFANDPAVIGDTLYISDNRSDQLVRVEPADFLKSKRDPKITVVFKGKGVFPNGLYPGRNSSLYMVGFEGKDKPQGIYRLPLGKDEPVLVSDKFGMLDGLYRMQRRRHPGDRLEHRLAVPMEQEDGRAQARRRLQGPGRLLRHPERQRPAGGRARPGQGRTAFRTTRPLSAPIPTATARRRRPRRRA